MRKYLSVAGLAIMVLLLIGRFYLNRENDPNYKGRPFSAYLDTLPGVGLDSGRSSDGVGRIITPIEPKGLFTSLNGEVEEAISAVGTNALPKLVAMLGSKDSIFALWLEKKAQTYPALKRLDRRDPNTNWVRQGQAATAFYKLGPRALPAVPGIVRLLDDPQCAGYAILSLMNILPVNRADILALTVSGRIKLYHPGSNQSVPPRRGLISGFRGCVSRVGCTTTIGNAHTDDCRCRVESAKFPRRREDRALQECTPSARVPKDCPVHPAPGFFP